MADKLTPITTKEAAEIVGIHQKTLLKEVARGNYAGCWRRPTTIPNGRVVFYKEKLEAFLERDLQSSATHQQASA